jgi:hypothetical protein
MSTKRAKQEYGLQSGVACQFSSHAWIKFCEIAGLMNGNHTFSENKLVDLRASVLPGIPANAKKAYRETNGTCQWFCD